MRMDTTLGTWADETEDDRCRAEELADEQREMDREAEMARRMGGEL